MGGASPSWTPDAQLFRDVFNGSTVGIIVKTLEGQLVFVNPAFCSFLGFSEDELYPKQCADFSPPEDAEKDLALFQQLRAGSIDRYQLEKRYVRRDGSRVWGHLSISLLILFVVRPHDKQPHEKGTWHERVLTEHRGSKVNTGIARNLGNGTAHSTLLKHNDQTHLAPYSRSRERLRMGNSGPTLLDILSSEQFQTVMLLSLGLNTFQIADLLETNERAVSSFLSDSLDRTGCRSAGGLTVRLIFENENNLYDERLEKEVAALRNAAKRMLEKVASILRTMDSRKHPRIGWVI